MLDDLVRFCQLNVDTTFDVVPGLWLTDTPYKHLGLVDKNDSHPEFPGPMMLNFSKTRKEFRGFAMEIAVQRPELSECIEKIGHDLDKATALGVQRCFQKCQTHVVHATSSRADI